MENKQNQHVPLAITDDDNQVATLITGLQFRKLEGKSVGEILYITAAITKAILLVTAGGTSFTYDDLKSNFDIIIKDVVIDIESAKNE